MTGPEDVIIADDTLIFNPATTQLNVGVIEIASSSLSGGQKEYNISIGRIEAVNIPGVWTAVLGDPVRIIVSYPQMATTPGVSTTTEQPGLLLMLLLNC